MNRQIMTGILVWMLLLLLSVVAMAAGAWQVDPNTGCKVWNPNPQPDEIFSWTGGCKNGYLDGTGILTWLKHGVALTKMEGFFVQGKLHGKGSFSILGTRFRYEGDYVEGIPHGKGILTGANGNLYEGDFRNGHFQGKGVFTWANGDRYEGEWVESLRTGQGVFTWANGDQYEGEFAKNKMHGYGVLTYKEGRVLRGRFENGLYVGR